jgi:hypothetical protein
MKALAAQAQKPLVAAVLAWAAAEQPADSAVALLLKLAAQKQKTLMPAVARPVVACSAGSARAAVLMLFPATWKFGSCTDRKRCPSPVGAAVKSLW